MCGAATKSTLNDDQIVIRPVAQADLVEIAQIQSACPEAAQWNVEDCLACECLVALCEGRVAGFLASRKTSVAESEILNLAVHPEFRRRGVARRLVEHMAAHHPGNVFLEVRASNRSAQKFYQLLGFQVVGRRAAYYESGEAAIVMKFYSC